ncbi:MAG: FKBP-type peptidyl-prolyl cis-trans isomerase N-terminal domain-containing protein [Akkermansiaceae bacterium]
MKKKYTTITLALAGIISAGQVCAQAPAQPAPGAPPVKPAAPTMSAKEAFTIGSYVLGHQQGQGLHGAGFGEKEFSADELMKGLMAGLKGEKSSIPEEKMRAAMQVLQGLARERQQKKAEQKLVDNKAFLESNGKREGVKTTASGLQYEVLKKGGDRKYVAPAGGGQDTGTKFILHYKGTLIDGEEFDSSIKHQPDGKPAEFGLGVVPGFAEALKMMPVGAKWKVFIPSALGYGASPRGPGGPNSLLIFEIELVDIKAAPATPPAPPQVQPGPPRPKASATTPPVRVPAPPKPAKTEKAE